MLLWKFLKILVENITGETSRETSTDQSIDSILNNLLYTRVCMYDYHFPFFFFLFLFMYNLYVFCVIICTSMCIYISYLRALREGTLHGRAFFIYLSFFFLIIIVPTRSIFSNVYIYILARIRLIYIYI